METAWTGLDRSLIHFSGHPCFDAEMTFGNVKSHVWHADMNLRNAKMVGLNVFSRTTKAYLIQRPPYFPNRRKIKSQ